MKDDSKHITTLFDLTLNGVYLENRPFSGFGLISSKLTSRFCKLYSLTSLRLEEDPGSVCPKRKPRRASFPRRAILLLFYATEKKDPGKACRNPSSWNAFLLQCFCSWNTACNAEDGDTLNIFIRQASRFVDRSSCWGVPTGLSLTFSSRIRNLP